MLFPILTNYMFLAGYLCDECIIPPVIRGVWFSWENGQPTQTELTHIDMSSRGRCVDMLDEYHTNYTFVFQNNNCFHCVKFLVRTVNVLEKIECKLHLTYISYFGLK